MGYFILAHLHTKFHTHLFPVEANYDNTSYFSTQIAWKDVKGSRVKQLHQNNFCLKLHSYHSQTGLPQMKRNNKNMNVHYINCNNIILLLNEHELFLN